MSVQRVLSPESYLLDHMVNALSAVYREVESGAFASYCPSINPYSVSAATDLDLSTTIACMNMLAVYGVIDRHQSELHIEYSVKGEGK